MFAPSFAAAQSDSLLYFQNDSLTEAGKGELRLHIENLNFFRNDEYASSFSNGYTLPGFFLAPWQHLSAWPPTKTFHQAQPSVHTHQIEPTVFHFPQNR